MPLEPLRDAEAYRAEIVDAYRAAFAAIPPEVGASLLAALLGVVVRFDKHGRMVVDGPKSPRFDLVFSIADTEHRLPVDPSELDGTPVIELDDIALQMAVNQIVQPRLVRSS